MTLNAIRPIASIYLAETRTLALRTLAFSQATIPGEWESTASSVYTKDILALAQNTYALIDCLDLKKHPFNDVDFYSVEFSVPPEGKTIKKFMESTDRIRHCKKFAFGWAHADHKKLYSNSKANLIPTYCRVSRGGEDFDIISIYGFSFIILNEFIELAQSKISGV